MWEALYDPHRGDVIIRTFDEFRTLGGERGIVHVRDIVIVPLGTDGECEEDLRRRLTDRLYPYCRQRRKLLVPYSHQRRKSTSRWKIT